MTLLDDLTGVGSSLITRPQLEEPPQVLRSVVLPAPIVIKTWGYRPSFIDHAERELTKLMSLRAGWDGQRAKRITQQAIFAAIEVQIRLLDEAAALPQYFPLIDGGIQLEWYAAGDEISIEIDSDGEAHVLAFRNGDLEIEGLLSLNGESEICSSARNFLKTLSQRVAAAH